MMELSNEALERYQMSKDQYNESSRLAFETLAKGGTKADMIHHMEANASCMKVAIMAAMFVGHMLNKMRGE